MNVLHRLLLFPVSSHSRDLRSKWTRRELLLHFSHFISTSARHKSTYKHNTGWDGARRDLAKASNQSFLRAQGDHFKCWLFILLETENGGGGWWACGGAWNYNPPSKQKLFSLLSGCLSVKSLSSPCFRDRGESKTERLRYRLKSCTRGDLITETLAPPPARQEHEN